jgi:hypothetical protein
MKSTRFLTLEDELLTPNSPSERLRKQIERLQFAAVSDLLNDDKFGFLFGTSPAIANRESTLKRSDRRTRRSPKRSKV